MGSISFELSQPYALAELGGLLVILLIVGITTLRGRLSRTSAAWSLILIAATQVGIRAGFFTRSFFVSSDQPLAQYLLPPHNQLLLEKMIHSLVSVWAGWIAAAALLVIGWFIFIRRSDERFLDGRDLLLLTIGAASVGWPSVFLFLAAVFVLSVVGMLLLVLVRKKSLRDRLIVTPFILPAALLVLLTKTQLLFLTDLISIRF